jgi:hypothetical protein
MICDLFNEQLINVKITFSEDYDLFGKIIQINI